MLLDTFKELIFLLLCGRLLWVYFFGCLWSHPLLSPLLWGLGENSALGEPASRLNVRKPRSSIADSLLVHPIPREGSE